MKESLLYKIVRPIVSIWFKIFYKPKYIGLNNIPDNESIILAGNHKNNLDCIYLMSSTKRPIHFLAKQELFKGIKKIIFAINMMRNLFHIVMIAIKIYAIVVKQNIIKII